MTSREDPYVLPNGTLRNALGLTDAAKLTGAEADLVSIRDWILRSALPRPPYTFDTLKAIHRTLFQDVYAWAGEPRVVPLGRRELDAPDGPVQMFSPPEEIAPRVGAAFRRLADKRYLSGASPAVFADGAADFLVEINGVHPFRDGNGRTQRVMLEAIARNAGHHLAFDIVTRERMASVSIAGHKGDKSGVRRMIDEILDARQIGAMRRALDFLHNRTAAAWNELYIATTSGGRSYHGTLVGRSGDDFMLRTSEGGTARLYVGDARDLPPWAVTGDAIRLEARRFTPTQTALDLTPSRPPNAPEFEHAPSSIKLQGSDCRARTAEPWSGNRSDRSRCPSALGDAPASG